MAGAASQRKGRRATDDFQSEPPPPPPHPHPTPPLAASLAPCALLRDVQPPLFRPMFSNTQWPLPGLCLKGRGIRAVPERLQSGHRGCESGWGGGGGAVSGSWKCGWGPGTSPHTHDASGWAVQKWGHHHGGIMSGLPTSILDPSPFTPNPVADNPPTYPRVVDSRLKR